MAAEETAATVDATADDNGASIQDSGSDEEAGEVESAAGGDDVPDDQEAAAVFDATIAAVNDACEEKTVRDTSDTLEDRTPAGVSTETSWAWALDSVGHVRGPSTSSSCTAESVGTASRASSWAEVHTPPPRRKSGGCVVDEWEVVLNADEGCSASLCLLP
jgi:hypothetical protein